VVVTHPDKDHAEGLEPILQNFEIGVLWMLCPWHYAPHIIQYFPRYQSVDSLVKRLQDEYPYIHELEKIALRRNIPIMEPFQGKQIGSFTILAPSPARYLQLVLQSEKTPQEGPVGILSALMQVAAPIIRFIKAGWGSEKFSSDPTSVENEMSVIQYAQLCGDRILLTGDAGRDGLTEAAVYAQSLGLPPHGFVASQMLLHPCHVAQQLAYHPFITTRDFEFDDDIVSLRISCEDIDEAPSHRELDPGQLFVREQGQTGFKQPEILSEVVPCAFSSLVALYPPRDRLQRRSMGFRP
jgi:hypothetical protein